VRPAFLAALLVLSLAPPVLAADQPEPEPPVEHDPWQGMDRDGRIPAVEKPVTHPERWRYIPEGRIKPGNVLERFLISSFIAPFFFRDTDVGIGGGLALTDIDFREQRRREFLGLFVSHTEEGQQAYTLLWQRWLHHIDLPQGGVLQEERSRVRAGVSYSRTLTRRFFGFGDDTDEDDETSFADEFAFAAVGMDVALPEAGDDLVLGIGVRGEWHNLAKGHVDDAGQTKDVFPDVFDDGDRDGLGWLDLELRWDTRDSEIMPYRGFDVGARIQAAPVQSEGNAGSIFGVFGSKFFPLPGLFHSGGTGTTEEHPPTDSIALHLETETTAGDLPFYSLPSLGGAERARGFIEGRFRDRSLWAATAEYRFWVIPRGFALSPWTPTVRVERLGLALFYDVGSVEDEWWDLFHAEPKHSGGVGFRCTLERNAPFRVDVGFSDEGPQVTAGFGLSF
jgi:surface antigen Omp85-like protein